MIRPRTAVLLLALVPATVAAQAAVGRGGSRMGGAGQDQSSRGSGGVELKLSNGDVEDMSPVKLLIDKRKDLKLSDAQVKQLKDLESEMKTRNENLFHQLDSLRKDMSSSTRGSEDGRTRAAYDREAVQGVVANIRLSYSETLKRVTPLLDDAQKTKADAARGKAERRRRPKDSRKARSPRRRRRPAWPSSRGRVTFDCASHRLRNPYLVHTKMAPQSGRWPGMV